MNQTVREVMTSNPVCMSPSTSLSEAAMQMRESDIGDVLLVENSELRGIITDRDIAIRAVADGRDPRATTIKDIASGKVHTISADSPVSDAVSLMRKHALRRLPVTDGNKPVGIVSIGDLAASVDRGSALADISMAPPTR